MLSKKPTAIYKRHWRHRHKKLNRYLSYRSKARSFIRNYAKHQDLLKMVEECNKELSNK